MAKYNPSDPETLKIPAFQRKVAITNHARQKLLWTALDRKEAGVKPNSTKPVARAPLTRTPLTRAPRNFERPAAAPTQQTVPTPIQRSAPAPSTLTSPKKLKPAGEITHFLDKIDVAIIKLTKPLQNGDILLIEGSDYLFVQPVKEMQIDRKPVEKARKGDHIGMKVGYAARVGGHVYLT